MSKIMGKYIRSFFIMFACLLLMLPTARAVRAEENMSNPSISINDLLDLDLINQNLVDYDQFDASRSSLPSYYNLAFKATIPVTCFINPANIEDSRFIYMNWASIYGLSATAQNVVMPQPYASHRGQDWNSAISQEPLYAINDGVVTRAAYDSSYGNRIDYTFGKWTVYYAHMSSMNVRVGDRVSAGQLLGRVGSTGNVTGEHVHIGMLYDGKLIDPHPFLTGTWTFAGKEAEINGGGSQTLQKGIYKNNYGLDVRIRSGAGTNYSIVGNITPGSIVNITSISVSGTYTWGQHSSGYSCIKEGSLLYLTPIYTGGTYRNIAGDNLMVRSSPNTTAPIVGSVAPGSTVTISDFAITNGNQIWGRHAGGWSCINLNGTVYLQK